MGWWWPENDILLGHCHWLGIAAGWYIFRPQAWSLGASLLRSACKLHNIAHLLALLQNLIKTLASILLELLRTLNTLDLVLYGQNCPFSIQRYHRHWNSIWGRSTKQKSWFYGIFSHIEKHFYFTVLTFSGGNWGPPNPMGNIPIFSSFSWIERPNLLKGTKLIGYHFPLFECFSTPKRFWNAKNYLGNWDQLMGMRRPLSPSPKNSHKIQFLFAVHPLRAFLKSVTFNFVGFYGQTFPLRWFLC